MGIEQWWNDTDRGKNEILEKNVFHSHSVHHKSHMDWPGIEAATRPFYFYDSFSLTFWPSRYPAEQPTDHSCWARVGEGTFSTTGLWIENQLCISEPANWPKNLSWFMATEYRQIVGEQLQTVVYKRRLGLNFVLFNPLNTKRRLLYLNTQFVPRSKHFSSRL